MKPYKCKCGHTTYAQETPPPIHWTDGHTCTFKLVCWCCEEEHEPWDCGLCYTCYWWATDKQIARELDQDANEAEIRNLYWKEIQP